jgi:hypothetical protein
MNLKSRYVDVISDEVLITKNNTSCMVTKPQQRLTPETGTANTDWMKRLNATPCGGILLLHESGIDRDMKENQLWTSLVSI